MLLTDCLLRCEVESPKALLSLSSAMPSSIAMNLKIMEIPTPPVPFHLSATDPRHLLNYLSFTTTSSCYRLPAIVLLTNPPFLFSTESSPPQRKCPCKYPFPHIPTCTLSLANATSTLSLRGLSAVLGEQEARGAQSALPLCVTIPAPPPSSSSEPLVIPRS